VAAASRSAQKTYSQRAARWEYVFWADLAAALADPALAGALDALRDHAAMVRVLGSYPRATEE
jgi:chorismate mutase/prephenate dehydratase